MCIIARSVIHDYHHLQRETGWLAAYGYLLLGLYISAVGCTPLNMGALNLFALEIKYNSNPLSLIDFAAFFALTIIRRWAFHSAIRCVVGWLLWTEQAIYTLNVDGEMCFIL